MRVRFAPSPTGFLHIGNARTAVINYIVSKKYNADLVLRVEDTDIERSTIESERSIMDDLRWLGIEWTEGPDMGGNFGPYRQSERFDIYAEYTKKLLSEGKAYHCYCTKEELEDMRKDSEGKTTSFEYSGKCRHLTAEQKAAYETEGRKPTVRFQVPPNEKIQFDDHLKGSVEFDSGNIGGDFIIVRSDGVPVYNYIVVIDDALMEVSHVVRGEDHLSNTPKQILIARALGINVPEYAHLPLIVGSDRAKLSKRHGITSVNLYREEGYLPQALVNYLTSLGWSTEAGSEIMPFDEMLKEFELDKLGKSSAIFDFQKLKWMNNAYIKQLPGNELAPLFSPYIEKAGYDINTIESELLNGLSELLKGNCEVLSDIKAFAGIFLDNVCKPDDEADAMLNEDYAVAVIKAASDIAASLTPENFTDFLEMLKEKSGQSGKKLFMPARAIITGRLKGPDLHRALPLIGLDRLLQRINFCGEKYAH